MLLLYFISSIDVAEQEMTMVIVYHAWSDSWLTNDCGTCADMQSSDWFM